MWLTHRRQSVIVNDLEDDICRKVLTFADDTKVFSKVQMIQIKNHRMI